MSRAFRNISEQSIPPSIIWKIERLFPENERGVQSEDSKKRGQKLSLVQSNSTISNGCYSCLLEVCA
jgi:hypothetical protein